MSHHTQTLPPQRRIAALVIGAIAVFGSAFVLTAQTPAKKALTVDDYTRWRSISSQELSGDGKWVSYVVQFTNVPTSDTKPALHLMNLGTNQDVEIPNATNASFSADSRWLAYQVDPTAGRGGRGGRGGGGGGGAGGQGGQGGQGGGATGANTAPGAGAQGGRGANAQAQPPQQRRVELRNLETGAVAKQWQDIASFNFSADSNYLLLRRRPAQAAGGAGRAGGGDAPAAAPAGGGGAAAAGAAPANPDAPRGTDITIHNLQTGKDQQIGNVGDSSFNKKGDLLAYSVDLPVKDGNGLFLVDLKASRTIALDNDAKSYNRLTWSEDGEHIAVLKGLTPDKMRERENVLLVLSNVRAALGDGAPAVATLDPAKTTGFPKGSVISDRATLSWSDDGKRVFFGMKEQVATPEATPRRSTDEVADVDVWNSMDERIQSVQMTRADQDRNFTFREAFDASNGKFVKLTDETMRDLELSQDGRWAVGRDTRGYISDYKPAAADFYRVNTSTGERTLILKNQLTGAGALGISPDGNYYMFWKDDRFQAYDLNAAQLRPLGGPASPTAPKFTNIEFDHPGPKPSYGIAGYTSDGRNVIVQQRYDLWVMPLDGTAAKNLTNGAGTKGEIRFRYVRTEPSDAGGGGFGGGGGRGGGGGPRGTIDLSRPVTLSAYGEWTKKAGFYELANGQLREIVYEDASFSTPAKAAKADTYLFTRQTFVEFPDLRVSGPNFKESKKITDVNPQQSEFLWGHRVLFDFQDRYKHHLQGILVLPDDYKPGEKRPMLVNFYEDNSQNMHRYSAPSYLTGMGSSPIQAVTEGYVTMIPDIHYHTGSSHSDQLDSVEAATRKVIEMGYVDPKRIGINGHSYGGEGAAFIGTRSRLFAAVGVGAGVTDLFTDFSQSWGWSYQVSGGSGANGNDYYLYGQGRWGFSPWEKPDVYHFESALSHVPEVTAPILIMHGTADPTVSFSEGMNFFNALRYNGKNAIMLAYPGEGHGLRGLANRKDLTIRYFQFFDHYLKDAPAPKWMTDGIPYLEKDQNKDPRVIKK